MHWILPEARILPDLFPACEVTMRLRTTVRIGTIRRATSAGKPDGEAGAMPINRGRRVRIDSPVGLAARMEGPLHLAARAGAGARIGGENGG